MSSRIDACGGTLKIQILSANLAGFDRPVENVEQQLPVEEHRFTDADFSPRLRVMSSRLQARVPKMFGWDMTPESADVYIWLDSSFRLSDPKAARWFVMCLGYCDVALFKHPKRKSIQAEAAHIEEKLAAGSPYITDRYAGEDITGQLRAIRGDGFMDDTLYATMAFAYRPTTRVKAMMTDWWVHTSRFHAVDQLALPFVLWKHGCSVARLDGDPYSHKMIEYTRGQG